MQVVNPAVRWLDRVVIAPYTRVSAAEERATRLATWLSLVFMISSLNIIILGLTQRTS